MDKYCLSCIFYFIFSTEHFSPFQNIGPNLNWIYFVLECKFNLPKCFWVNLFFNEILTFGIKSQHVRIRPLGISAANACKCSHSFLGNQYVSTAPEDFKNKRSAHTDTKVDLEPHVSACTGHTEPEDSRKESQVLVQKQVEKTTPSICIT